MEPVPDGPFGTARVDGITTATPTTTSWVERRPSSTAQRLPRSISASADGRNRIQQSMEFPPSTRTRGWLHLSTDELARRAHAEPTMGLVFVVVGDPGADPRQDRVGVGPGLDAGIVALERLHERLAHPVALGRAYRREAGHEVQGCREGQRLGGRKGRAVVRQPLHGMGRAKAAEASFQAAEARLHAGQHEIPHHLAGDPTRRGHPGDHLAIMGVDGEGYPHRLAVPAADLQPIRGPALVRGRGDHTALVGAHGSPARVALEEQAVPLHQAEHPLVVQGGLASGAPRADLLGGGPAPSTLNAGQDLAVHRRGGRIG